jgi:hypothetical protein
MLTAAGRDLAILRAAKAHARTLKSIAVTGSINASTLGTPEHLKQGPLNSDTWLPVTREEARKANNPYISYCSAKKEGELALWDFVKSQKPHFTVTVFLPALSKQFLDHKTACKPVLTACFCNVQSLVRQLNTSKAA